MTINDFERARGFLIRDLGESDPGDTISEKDFNELTAHMTNVHPVNWEDREKFLTDNGYAINRVNMVDSSLSAKSNRRSQQ